MYRELETDISFVEDVTSLYNVRNTRGDGDKLITDDLLELFPLTDLEFADIKRIAMESYFYKDLLIS